MKFKLIFCLVFYHTLAVQNNIPNAGGQAENEEVASWYPGMPISVGNWVPESDKEHEGNDGSERSVGLVNNNSPMGKFDQDHECYDCVLCCIDKLERTLKLIGELQELNQHLFLKLPSRIDGPEYVPEHAQGAARAYIGKREKTGEQQNKIVNSGNK